MIRINLLATERKTEKKKAAAAPGALQLYLFLGLFIGGAAVLCAGAYWFKEGQLKELDAQIQKQTQRQQALQVIKKQVEEFQAKEAQLKRQKELIEDLKEQQTSGVHMLDEVSKALPDFVWLQSLDQAGPQLKFAGQSNSLAAVADFISALQKAGEDCDANDPKRRSKCWFPRVELDSSTETNSVVTFQLTAAFDNPGVAAKKAAAAAAAAAPPAPAPPKKS